MLHRFLLLLLTLICLNANLTAQKLVSYELIRTESPEVITTLIPALLETVAPNFPVPLDSVIGIIDAQYEADLYKVVYKTTHPVLGEIDATGAIGIPRGIDYECGLATAIYQHGTTFSRTGVPSYGSLEINFGSMLATSGYVTLLPDYMGLGDSPGMHPYVHGPTEALAAIDLMRATRELQEELDFTLNGQNFIFGYSQGGHGAMALFYELEQNYADEFEATAAAPMSGPYNISEIQANVMFIDYATPSYLPYTLIGYQGVYPELKEQFPIVFNEEWAALNGFDGDTDDFFEIMNTLDIPSFAFEMFDEDLLSDFVLNPNHPLKVAFREAGDYYDWHPNAPLMIMGCCDDEQVMIENLYFTKEKMEEKGVENFQAIDWCDEFPEYPQFGHNGCIPFCLVKGKQFFDGMRLDCNVTSNNEEHVDLINLSLSPNPTEGILQIDWDESIGVFNSIDLFNVNGQLVFRAAKLSEQSTINIADLPNGFYLAELNIGNQKVSKKIIKQ